MNPARFGILPTWRIVIGILGGLTLLSSFSYLLDQSTDGRGPQGTIALDMLQTMLLDGQKNVALNQNYCSVEDVVHGEWVVKRSLGSMEDLFERYGFSDDAYVRCEPVDTPPVVAEDGSKTWPIEAILRRTLAVASPELVPLSAVGYIEGETGHEHQCMIAPLSPKHMIKRLLRSRLGLTLVGDSLTEQHLLQLFNFFSSVPYIKYREETHVMARWTISLDFGEDRYLDEISEIIEEAGVSRERAAQPFIYFWRHHHLLTPEESTLVFGNFSDDFVLTPDPIGTDWYAEMREHVYASDLLVPEAQVREEPSVIILNTGPHWNVGEFGALSRDAFQYGYERMVDLVDEKVRSAPFPLSSYWRPNLPGQIDCAVFDDFDNTRSDLFSPVHPHKGAHNYLWFSWMNDIMRRNRALQRSSDDWLVYLSESKSKTGTQNPPGLYFDAYPMSVKRPEAHHSPPVDCLHWCEVGVPDRWTQLMWHMMVLESTNADYE